MENTVSTDVSETESRVSETGTENKILSLHIALITGAYYDLNSKTGVEIISEPQGYVRVVDLGGRSYFFNQNHIVVIELSDL